MPSLQEPTQDVTPPTAFAALLLAAIPLLKRLSLPHPQANEALAALGDVKRSWAYTLKERLLAGLPDLVGPTGRPPAPPTEAAPPEIATQVLAFLYAHPGAVSGSDQRRTYSRGFTDLVHEIVEEHADVPRDTVAHALSIPLPTLKDWLRADAARGDAADAPDEPPAAARGDAPDAPDAPDALGASRRQTQIATLLDAWKHWSGSFLAFCKHAEDNLHLPFKRQVISTILQGYGVRQRSRRPGRSPDELATRESFETFFPNAQWVGDGTELSIVINGKRYACNLELIVDPYSGAFVGADVRPTEDAAAVVSAFDDAEESTQAQAQKTLLALLLDNKPSNHAPEVLEAVDPAIVMRATTFRPENKAHVEGAFGLLKPTLGEPQIAASTVEGLAQTILAILVTLWARTLNHRPRRQKNGQTRAQLLCQTPSPEDIAHARERIEEIQRRHELARKTLAARQDPSVRAFIADAIARLNLDDPEGHVLTSIARYPLKAIAEGVAIYEGRQRAGTLSETADVRFLLGIVRNVSQDREAWAIGDALWEERLRAKDIALGTIEDQRDALVSSTSLISDLVDATIDKALEASWIPERTFWLKATAQAITTASDVDAKTLYRRAVRHIQGAYQLPNSQRQAAIRILADLIVPLP